MISFSSFCLSASTRRSAMQRDTMEQNRLLKDRKQTHFLFFFFLFKKMNFLWARPKVSHLCARILMLSCQPRHCFPRVLSKHSRLHASAPLQTSPYLLLPSFCPFFLVPFFLFWSKRKMII